MPLSIGTQLRQRYRVVKTLDEQPDSVLYRAWDLNLNVAVALKQLVNLPPGAQAAIGAQLQVLTAPLHVSLPRVTDHFEVPGYGYFVVLSYVDSEDWDTALQRRGALPPQKAADLIGKATEAVAQLHKHGLTHGNLNPATVRLTTQDDVIIADVGRLTPLDPATAAVLSIGYTAPEQLAQGINDVCTDIYALGALLYRATIGQPPPDSRQRYTPNDLPGMTVLNTSGGPDLQPVIARAMEVLPQQRYASAQEFKAALASAAGMQAKTVKVGVAPTPIPTMKVPAQFKPRRQVMLIGVAVLAIGLIGLIGLGRLFPASTSSPALLLATLSTSTSTPTILASSSPTLSPTPSATPSPVVTVISSRGQTVLGHTVYLPVVMQRARIRTAIQTRATATIEAKLAATALAQSTLVAQQQTDWLKQVEAGRTRQFGPQAGELAHQPNEPTVHGLLAKVALRDVSIEAEFSAPYTLTLGSWDYGFAFRRVGPDQEYRLIVRSDGVWRLINVRNDQIKLIQWGRLNALNTSVDGSNTIKVVAKDRRGQLWINGSFVAELDLSMRANSGDVLIATGLFAGDEVANQATRYRQFTVWALK